jgi:hypothetical protein
MLRAWPAGTALMLEFGMVGEPFESRFVLSVHGSIWQGFLLAVARKTQVARLGRIKSPILLGPSPLFRHLATDMCA